jgi:hypothetical protein
VKSPGESYGESGHGASPELPEHPRRSAGAPGRRRVKVGILTS